jgi:hypothetical protein
MAQNVACLGDTVLLVQRVKGGVKLVPVLVSLDELIRQRVNQEPTDRNIPVALPCPHHPTEGNEVAVALDVPRPDSAYFRLRIRYAPFPAIVGIGEREAVVLVDKSRNDLKGDSVGKRDKDKGTSQHLSAPTLSFAGLTRVNS